MAGSEIARLKEQIELVCVAMQLGLSGIAEGAPRHTFISNKTRELGKYQEQLNNYIGEDNSIAFMVDAYDRSIRHGNNQ